MNANCLITDNISDEEKINPLHGCGDQSGGERVNVTYQPVIVYYDILHDCFWLIGNGKKLRLPSGIRLDRAELGTDVFKS